MSSFLLLPVIGVRPVKLGVLRSPYGSTSLLPSHQLLLDVRRRYKIIKDYLERCVHLQISNLVTTAIIRVKQVDVKIIDSDSIIFKLQSILPKPVNTKYS